MRPGLCRLARPGAAPALDGRQAPARQDIEDGSARLEAATDHGRHSGGPLGGPARVGRLVLPAAAAEPDFVPAVVQADIRQPDAVREIAASMSAGWESRQAKLLADRLETLEDAVFARLMRKGWVER